MRAQLIFHMGALLAWLCTVGALWAIPSLALSGLPAPEGLAASARPRLPCFSRAFSNVGRGFSSPSFVLDCPSESI
ncbi:uncharacterized protein P884DRAFT_87793 [Thermothelomyces heterothallicus CBS 202.75]|uniref:uncharacterized protein n=1 Tax=Thermothelomyces heterothallicus CBS 202.75 TaxID=1149848 RepID=UPI003743E3F8